MKKKTVIVSISAFVAALLVGAVVWAIISGKLTVAWNGFGGNFSTAPAVCDSKVVATYNEATEYTYDTATNTPPALDIESMRKTAEDIKSRSGYENDPTCQVILFWTAIEDTDTALAEESLAALKALHEKRLFPDNNLRTASPLFEYDMALTYSTSSEQDTQSE